MKTCQTFLNFYDALLEVMLEMEGYEGGETLNLENIVPHVVYEHNHMYKSTMISPLKNYPILSKNRDYKNDLFSKITWLNNLYKLER